MVSKSGEVKSKCACYASGGTYAAPVVVMTLRVVRTNGAEIIDRNFCSKWHMSTYVYSHPIPPSVTAVTLNKHRRIKKAIKTSINASFRELNENGGADVLFWYKPGQIRDQTEEAMNNEANNGWNNNQNNAAEIRSSNVNYHIVSILPSSPMLINPVVMSGYKINIAEIVNSVTNNGN